MREIKFRAFISYGYTSEELNDPNLFEEIKETGLGFIDTPDLIDFKNQRIKYDSDWYENDRFKLMQSTGLKDKNGKEIYEGDILKTRTRGLVSVRKESGNMMVTYQSGVNTRTSLTLSSFLDRYKVVVIGNIYENPELLEGGGGNE